MITNYYVRKGYCKNRLEELKEKYLEDLRKVGSLYDRTAEEPFDEIQMTAIQLSKEGYGYGDQIHDLYSEIGAVQTAIDNLGEQND